MVKTIDSPKTTANVTNEVALYNEIKWLTDVGKRTRKLYERIADIHNDEYEDCCEDQYICLSILLDLGPNWIRQERKEIEENVNTIRSELFERNVGDAPVSTEEVNKADEDPNDVRMFNEIRSLETAVINLRDLYQAITGKNYEKEDSHGFPETPSLERILHDGPQWIEEYRNTMLVIINDIESSLFHNEEEGF